MKLSKIKLFILVIIVLAITLGFSGGSENLGGVTIDTALAGSATSTINSTQNNKLTDGLVSMWSFNGEDLTTTTATDSAGSNNGTLTNGPVPTIGRIGQALDFDGSNDYVSVADDPSLNFDINDPFTISIWIKTPTSATRGLVSKWDGTDGWHTFLFETGGKSRATLQFSDAATYRFVYGNIDLSDDSWHHITLSHDGSNTFAGMKIYVDGVEETYNTGSSGTVTSITNTQVVSLGARLGGTPLYFDGKIDDVRIYNRALSAAEIAHLYDLGNTYDINSSQNNKATDNLVGAWSFDGKDLTSTTATDSTGGNNGTITNAVPVIGRIGQALSFDGTGDYVSIATESDFDFDNTDSFTVVGWVRPQESGANQAIISKLDTSSPFRGWEVRQGASSDDKVTILVVNTITTNEYRARMTTALDIDQWNHFAVEYDGNDARFYLNGELDTTVTLIDNLSATTLNNLNPYIGSRQTTQVPYEGDVDELRVYDTSLTAAQIKHLYDIGR